MLGPRSNVAHLHVGQSLNAHLGVAKGLAKYGWNYSLFYRFYGPPNMFENTP
jgi:hypothetical protein